MKILQYRNSVENPTLTASTSNKKTVFEEHTHLLQPTSKSIVETMANMYEHLPPQAYPSYHGMSRPPLASKPVYQVNSNVPPPPPMNGWNKHHMMHHAPPPPPAYYENHHHSLPHHQQRMHYATSTPKATYPKSRSNNGRSARAMPFRSPTTLSFERMLSAGK
jgi:hypothetical protein